MMHFHRAVSFWRRPTLIILAFILATLLGATAPVLAATADALPVAQLFNQGRQEPTTQPSSQPLLAAGDGSLLWLVRPLTVEPKISGFEILVHPVNRRVGDRDLWLPVTRDQQRFFSGTPTAVAAISAAAGPQVCVIMQDGQVITYGLQASQPLPRVPQGRPVAALGLGEGLAVVTRSPAMEPEAATSPASRTATRPSKEEWLPWLYTDGRWQQLPTLGVVSRESAVTQGPSANAYIQLSRHGDTLVFLWIEPDHAHQLCVRTLSLTAATPAWSAPIISDLPEDVQHFQALTLSARVYVLWVRSDGLKQVLSGGTLDADYHFSARQRIDRVPLGLPGTAPIPANDMTISRTGDAISVLYEVSGKDSPLGSVTVSTAGKILYPAQDVSPNIKSDNDSNVLQHSAMILLILLLAISLWQWRKRPMRPNLPRGYMIARLYQRLAAALIDLAVAFGAVVLIFGLYEDDLGAILMSWLRSIIQLDSSANSLPFLSMWGIYIAHVTISELITCRTIGKKILGLKVIAIDGSQPTKLSLLLRNLMRVPELATRILLIYMVINEQRQRLGDLIARTTVVSDKPVEENGDARDDEDDEE